MKQQPKGSHLSKFKLNTSMCYRASNIFRESDEKHITKRSKYRNEKPLPGHTFNLQILPIMQVQKRKKDLPLVFKTTPESLINLALFVLDRIKLPTVFDWSNYEVCKWIREYGYPQYQHTFRVNKITGLKLILIGAQELCAMNIKNFDDIQRITYGIRQLYGYQLVKFGRNKSLPPENYYEHYELYLTQAGPSYKYTRPSDLWREMQLIRPNSKYLQHWQLLDMRMHPKNPPEVFADARRRKSYGCKTKPSSVADATKVEENICQCSVNCQCLYLAKKHAPYPPKGFTLLGERKSNSHLKKQCNCCLPPCTEHWPYKYYSIGKVLTCLKESFPHKYDPVERAAKGSGQHQLRSCSLSHKKGY